MPNDSKVGKLGQSSAVTESNDRLGWAVFDAHCHWDLVLKKSGEEASSARQLLLQQGMIGLAIPGLYAEQWANSRHGLIAADRCGAGYHPEFLPQLDEDHSSQSVLIDSMLARLRAELADKSVDFIGECGLDRRSAWPIVVQEQLLMGQLKLAKEFALPLVLHCVGAYDRLIYCLGRQKLPIPIYLHAFSASLDIAEALTKRGVYLGFGALALKEASKAGRAFKACPKELILLESDAPDMAPPWLKPGENHPLSLLKLSEELANLHRVGLSSLRDLSVENARRFFAH